MNTGSKKMERDCKYDDIEINNPALSTFSSMQQSHEFKTLNSRIFKKGFRDHIFLYQYSSYR